MEMMGLFYFALFIFGTTTTSLWPTTVKQFSLKSLTKNAVTVAWVHCDNTVPTLINNELYTNYEFTVIETIKGLHTPKLKLSLPGGNFQGQHYQIVGMPIFSPGTYELLFLTHAAPEKSAWPIGLYQGAARIISDKNGVDHVFFRQKPHLTKTLTPSKLTVMSQNKRYNGTQLSNVLTHIRSLISDPSNEY
jgi:hypothetical protein